MSTVRSSARTENRDAYLARTATMVAPAALREGRPRRREQGFRPAACGGVRPRSPRVPPDRQFPFTTHRPRQDQVRHVRARDYEHSADAARRTRRTVRAGETI